LTKLWHKNRTLSRTHEWINIVIRYFREREKKKREIHLMLQVNWVQLSHKKKTFKHTQIYSNKKQNDLYTPHSFSSSKLTLCNATVAMDTATTNSAEPHCSSELRLDGAPNDPNRTGSGQNSMARYKLMSPAKLPISRSPCITIPPGYSPTSFLESPVLLSNMKVSFLLLLWLKIEVFSEGKIVKKLYF
jgi:hypothetical protein